MKCRFKGVDPVFCCDLEGVGCGSTHWSGTILNFIIGCSKCVGRVFLRVPMCVFLKKVWVGFNTNEV